MTKTIELPINVYDMMKKYKDENRSFMAFMKGLPKNPDIWEWCNYPKYGSKEEILMLAWLDFDKVKTLALYYVELPKLVTSDGSQQYLSCKDMTYFASRKDNRVQQLFVLEQIPNEYYRFAKMMRGKK